jgi:outer membrane protein assembly factor BamB
LNGRQQQADEDGNNGDHHQQLDQREGESRSPQQRSVHLVFLHPRITEGANQPEKTKSNLVCDGYTKYNNTGNGEVLMKAISGWILTVACGLMLTSRIAPAADPPAQWPQWGGPNGDFTAEAPLAEHWPSQGPKVRWRRPLGEGYAAFVHDGKRLLTTLSVGDQEAVVALDPATGETLWEKRWKRLPPFPDLTKEYGPGPNATPLLLGNLVLAIGTCGQLQALRRSDGQLLWGRDLHAEYGRIQRKEEYGFSGQPLTFGGRAIVPVGGDKAAVVAFDPASGREVWRSAPGSVSYAPPALLRLLGKVQYIYFSPDEAVALDPDDGRRLWSFRCICSTGNNLTPAVRCDDEHVWIAGQLDAGTRLVRLRREGDRIVPKAVWEEGKLKQAHWNSHVVQNTLYGGLGGNFQSFLSAVDWRTGRVRWQERAGAVPKPILAGGLWLWLDQDGRLSLARPAPDRLERLASVEVLDHPSWTPPTLVGSTVYLRDRRQAVALDLMP